MVAKKATATREMTSQVNWVLLGLIIERPGYGYDLGRRLEDEYGGALPIASSPVYSALDMLEGRGLVEKVPDSGISVPRTKRQPKPRVRATDEGIRRFQEWLLTQIREDRRQSWIFLRQLAVFASKPEMALTVVSQMEQSYADEARNTPIAPPQKPGVAGLVERLATEERRLALAGRVPWVRYARREFEEIARTKRSERGVVDGSTRT